MRDEVTDGTVTMFRSPREPRLLVVWAVALALAAYFATPCAAQSSPDGQLGGTVRDVTGGVIAGATVSIRAPQLIGGARETKTGGDGTWRAPALPAGVYTVLVATDGFRPAQRDAVALDAGQTLTIDFELDVAGITETQIVEAPTPIVDVRTAAVPSNLGQGVLLDLPTTGVIANLINLVPGVIGDMAYGGTKMNNGIYVDGVDTTEPGEQGPWLRYGQNWLQEVQIVALGADAEHGKFTGVNAYGIVRSGTNRYSGLAEYWTTQSGWLANNTRKLSADLQRRFETERIESYWDLNAQLGGPVRRDRLWFFAGIEYLNDDRAPAGYDGPDLKQEDETRAIGKLTAAAWTGWRLEGFFQGGRQQVLRADIGPWVSSEAALRTRQPQMSWSSRALGTLGASWLLDVRYTGYDSPDIVDPMAQGTARDTPGHYDVLTGITSVNSLMVWRNDRNRHSVTATASYLSPRGWRRFHELTFGVEAERARELTEILYNGGMVYWDLGTTPYQRDSFSGSLQTGDTRHAAFFAQDHWQVHQRVTLLPGIRFDAFGASTSAADGVLRTNPVSPRLGLAWDVRGDHRTVVRAHYGRYTDQVFGQPVLLTDTAHSGMIITEEIDAAGVWHEISRRTPAGPRRIDPDIRHSYVDQVVVGAERQVRGDLSVQAQYIHRHFDQFMKFVMTGAVWDRVQRRDPGPDGMLGTADDGAMFTVYDLTNPSAVVELYTNADDGWRRYDAVQVVARKRESNSWQAQASYTWSRTSGTVANTYHTNTRGRAPGPNELINGDASLPHDPTNEVKLLGSWRAPWLGGFTVAGVYRYTTGAAWGRTFVATGLGQRSASILAEPRGTRRVDAINNLDLRLEKTVPMGGSRRLGVYVDVFNVWNQGVPDSDWVVPVNTSSGSSLGVPSSWRPARQVRLSVRMLF